jgi:hypothetical protein
MSIISKVKDRFMPSFFPKQTASFTVRGSPFNASALELGAGHITKLGIKKSIYVDGLKLYVLSKPDFARLCGIKEFSVSGKIEGMYPLSKPGEMESVYRGSRNRLPAHSRIIVVPEGHDRRALTHEAMHDVFLGCFTKDDRDTFFKCVGAWFLRIKKEGSVKEKDFFEEVNIRAAEEYNLKAIRPWNFANSFIENNFSDEFKLFAGECFAYAGELLVIGKDKKEYLGELPREMANYFVSKGILKKGI